MEVSNLGQVNQVSDSIDSQDKSDIQLLFAKLQIELANSNKSSAMEKIKDIKANQAMTKKIVDATIELRAAIDSLKDDQVVAADKIKNLDRIEELCDTLGVKSPFSTEDKQIMQAVAYLEDAKKMCESGKYFSRGEVGCIDKDNIPHLQEIINACKKAGVDVNINGVDAFGVNSIGWHTLNTYHFSTMIDRLSAKSKVRTDATAVQVKNLITNLEAKKDTIGSDVQQQMVLIQDYMGKYSAYTSGASSQIGKYADTLQNVARGQ